MQFLQSLKISSNRLDAVVSVYLQAVYPPLELACIGEATKEQVIAAYHHRVTEAVLDALPVPARHHALAWVACGRLEMVDLLLRAHATLVRSVVAAQNARFVARYTYAGVMVDDTDDVVFV
jgi:hypothetical protein